MDGFREEMRARVEARLNDLVEEVVHALPPQLVQGRPRPVSELRAGSRGLIEIVLRCLWEGRSMGAAECEILHAVGRRHADHGIAVEWLVDGARQSMRVIYQYVLAAAAQPPVSEATVTGLGVLSLELLDIRSQLTHALAAPYAASVTPVGRPQAQALFLHQLLEGHDSDEAELRAGADRLGLFLGPPCGTLLVMPAMSADLEQLEHTVAALGDALAASVSVAPRAAPTLHSTVIVPVVRSVSWTTACQQAEALARREGAWVLASPPVDSLSAVTPSHAVARDSLLLCREQADGPRLVHVQELSLGRLLQAVPVAAREAYVRETLGPVLALRGNHAQPLLDALFALADCEGRLSDAARILGLHVKGVRYRTGRISALTGLSFDVPGDRLRLDVAARLYRLGGMPLPDDEAWTDRTDVQPAWPAAPGRFAVSH